MTRVIIIEDEPAARKELQVLIEQEHDFEVLGYAGALNEAIRLIETQQPDLIFMDINLYDCNAFDILNALGTFPGCIIFVTAYDQYAIRAIKYGAFDYLLKPIGDDEFKEAVHRFRQHRQNTHSKEQVALAEEVFSQKQEPLQLALPSLGQIRIISINDIRYCKGDGPYTHFFLASGKQETVSKPLKFYESLLPESQFIRTHQSYIVHISRVQAIQNNATIVLDDGHEIPISHRRKNEVFKRIVSK